MIHGRLLSGVAFTDSAKVLTAAGYRMITYDRRGFRRPGKPHDSYDYNTLTADLDALLTGLDLHNVVLLGFSMSGGKMARYPAARGSERVGTAILSGSICPVLCITKDNPDDAISREGFQELAGACAANRADFIDQFCGWLYSSEQGLTAPKGIRQQAVKIARQSTPHAAVVTILTWTEDLRGDCRRIDIPLLMIHGDGGQSVPLAKSSAQIPEYAQRTWLVVIEGGPHGIDISRADQWNMAILNFLAGS